MSPKWYYDGIMLVEKYANIIEEEYISHLNGSRYGQLVYHCFGDGGSACIDFTKMKTYCSSAKCFCTHKKRNVNDDHLTFTLERI